MGSVHNSSTCLNPLRKFRGGIVINYSLKQIFPNKVGYLEFITIGLPETVYGHILRP